MLIFPTKVMSGVGASGIIRPYDTNAVLVGQLTALPIQNLGLFCTVSPGASLTYSVQVSGDIAPSATGNWNNHDTLLGLSASANGNILYGTSGIRLVVSALVSGSVSLGVVQWP